MLAQALFFYILLFFFLLPILISGIIILKRLSSLNRLELLLPAGSIIGITLFIFTLNSAAFIAKGFNGILLAYISIIVLAALLFRRQDFSKIYFPKNKHLILFITGFILWAGLIGWKGNFALIGSDTNLYYAISHTFIKGNFPPMTPWQPDLELSYHLGVFEFIGAFFAFTGLSFTFLHIFFSSFFILAASQIIIWIWKKHESYYSFLWANVVAAITLVSFGFLKFIIPIFPFNMPDISNFHQLFLWLRGLPTVNESIEVYGAPVNLDGFIYFIFHALGMAIFLSLLVMIINPGKKAFFEWIILIICGVSLSLINESIFIVVFPSLVLAKLFFDLNLKRLIDKKKLIFVLSMGLIVLLNQNAIIRNNIFLNNKNESSIIILPKENEIKEAFKSYHYYQQISKILEVRKEWLPFIWSHIGLEILLILSIVLFLVVKLSIQQKTIFISLFVSSIFSILAYNYIVPKFLIANGNRFLAFAFVFLSLLVTYLWYMLSEDLRSRKNKLLLITFILLSAFIILPTVVPPLIQLSKNRFGENKLIPRKEKIDEDIKWIRDSLSYDERILLLDIRAPHPSGIARVLTQAGVFSPIFTGDFRAYTIEASPEYFDIAYYLSPGSLKKLDIRILAIDSYFYKTLPILKQKELEDNSLFEVLFNKDYIDGSWKRIFRILPEYFIQEDSDGTIEELVNEHNFSGQIYIDSEKNFDPSFLKRALVFALRKKDLYFLPESGVYLNVESNINWSDPRGYKNYNYLVLSKDTNPYEICECKTRLIWKGLRGEVYLWQKID